jgi:hypothetical protein
MPGEGDSSQDCCEDHDAGQAPAQAVQVAVLIFLIARTSGASTRRLVKHYRSSLAS